MAITRKNSPAASGRSQTTCQLLTKLLSEHGEFILFDTETTGLSPQSAEIIQISALKVRSRDFQIIDKLNLYIRPSQPVPANIERLTGITNAFLRSADPEDAVFPKVAAFFGNTACGAYNLSFDRGFMEALYNRQGLSFQIGRGLFDVLKLSKETLPAGTCCNYKLGTVYGYLSENGLLDSPDKTVSISFHNAADDTLAMYQLFCSLYKKYLATAPRQQETALRGVIRTIQRWEGPGGRSRIYVNLKSPYGTVYYDLNRAQWANKDRDTDILALISLEQLRMDVFQKTGAKDESELWNFQGKA